MLPFSKSADPNILCMTQVSNYWLSLVPLVEPVSTTLEISKFTSLGFFNIRKYTYCYIDNNWKKKGMPRKSWSGIINIWIDNDIQTLTRKSEDRQE